LTYQKNPFNKIGFEIGVSKKMPSNDVIFPSPLLGHNSTILFGTLNPSFPKTANCELNYQRSDFYRGIQFYAALSGSLVNDDNSIAFFNYQDYTVRSFFRSNQHVLYRTSLHFEKYIQVIKTKSIFEYNSFFMKSPERVNNIAIDQTMMSNENKLLLISNWKRSLNLEASISILRSSILANNNSNHQKKTIDQYRGLLKMKMLISKKANASIIFNKMSYKGINAFYSGNGSVSYSIKKSIQASITFHNLFNKKQFSEKQYDLCSFVSRMFFIEKRYFLFSLNIDL
jgi:hypothetical protein